VWKTGQHFLSKSFVQKKKVEKGKKKKKLLDCIKLEYYKEVLDFSIIEYHIIFLITQILGQQCYASDSLGTRVH